MDRSVSRPYFPMGAPGRALRKNKSTKVMRTRLIISMGMLAAVMVGLGASPALTNAPQASVNARPSVTSDNDPESPITRLGRELNLNTDQKAKVQAVFDETRAKIQAAVQQAMTNADSQLHRILTPDQYQKLRQLEQEQQRPGAHPQNAPESGTGNNGK